MRVHACIIAFLGAAWLVPGCQEETTTSSPTGTPTGTSTGTGTATGTGSGSGTTSGTTPTGSGGVGGGATGGAGGTGGATGGTGGAAGAGGGTGGGAACTGSTDVMINEIRYDAPDNDNGNEWIELYNASASAVDISGWTIEAGTSSYGLRYTFPGSTSIAAGGYLVVGGQNISGADLTSATALNMGNASGSADAVRLTDGSGGIVDTVVYGTPNSDSWLDDCGATATSLAPDGTSSQVIARSPNGQDTNQSGTDFVATHTATMGAVNP